MIKYQLSLVVLAKNSQYFYINKNGKLVEVIIYIYIYIYIKNILSKYFNSYALYLKIHIWITGIYLYA